MTPTREQLETVCDAAADAYYWADRARRTRLGEVLSHMSIDLCMSREWMAYFALGEALRQTGTEPPQPAEGA